MAEFAADQADGLRKLLAKDFVRILALTSSGAGVGKSTAVLNLAAALALAGRKVMVLDENGSLCRRLGIEGARDLLDAAEGASLDELLVGGPAGISILQAARRGEGLEGGERLIERISEVGRPFDVVLVDTVPGSPGHLLSLSRSAQEMIVVLSTEGSSITDAYALIKMMNLNHGKRHFRILVNRAKTEEEARAVYDNMAKVARRYLAITLDYMGHVPQDDALRQASRLGDAVVQAFPLSAPSTRFRAMADDILGWPHPQQNEISLGEFLRHLIRSSRLSAADIRA